MSAGILPLVGRPAVQETFELLGEAGDGGGQWDEFLRAYLAGYEFFFRRDFLAAEQNFRIACGLKPADKVAAYYLQQAAKWVLSAPPPDWEGIYVVNSK